MLVPKLFTTLHDYTRAQFARDLTALNRARAHLGLSSLAAPAGATPTVAREFRA